MKLERGAMDRDESGVGGWCASSAGGAFCAGICA